MRSTFTVLVLLQVGLHLLAFLVAWGLERSRFASALRRTRGSLAPETAAELPARHAPATHGGARRRSVGAFRAST